MTAFMAIEIYEKLNKQLTKLKLHYETFESRVLRGNIQIGMENHRNKESTTRKEGECGLNFIARPSIL